MVLNLSTAFPFAVVPPCEVFPGLFGKRRDQKPYANTQIIGEQDANTAALRSQTVLPFFRAIHRIWAFPLRQSRRWLDEAPAFPLGYIGADEKVFAFGLVRREQD